MMQPHDTHEELERLIDSTLREQRPRRAPHALESRVLGELERRAALPWWRKHFTYWPLAARVAFLIASLGFINLAFRTVFFAVGTVHSVGVADVPTPLVTWVHTAAHFTSSMTSLGAALIRAIPPFWLYGGLIFAIAMYGALFALSAVAYRTLYATADTAGSAQ